METENALKSLQSWCKKATEGYKYVNVTNMTTSWRNGLGFCAIIHHFRPDLIDFESLSPENILHNNSLAFSVAEKQLGIPALLDAEDMVTYEVPDKLSICTYLSQYFQYFEGKGRFRYTRSAEKGLKNNGAALKLITNQVVSGERKYEICQTCRKRVFILERLIVDGKLYHRTCFKCCKCKSLLKPGAYVEGDVPGTYECSVCPKDEQPSVDKSLNKANEQESEKSDQLEVPSPNKKIEEKEIKLSLLSSTVNLARQNYFQRHLNAHSSEHKKYDEEASEKTETHNSVSEACVGDKDLHKVDDENSCLLNTQQDSEIIENGTNIDVESLTDDESSLKFLKEDSSVEQPCKTNLSKPPIAKKPDLQLSFKRQSVEIEKDLAATLDKQTSETAETNIFSTETSHTAESSRRSSAASSASSIDSSPQPSGRYQSVFLSDRLKRLSKPISFKWDDDSTSDTDRSCRSADYNTGSQLDLPVIKSSSYSTSENSKLPRPHSIANFRQNSDSGSLTLSPLATKGKSDESIYAVHNRWSRRSSEFLNVYQSKTLKEPISSNKLLTPELNQKEYVSSFADVYRRDSKPQLVISKANDSKPLLPLSSRESNVEQKEAPHESPTGAKEIKPSIVMKEEPFSMPKEQVDKGKEAFVKLKQTSYLPEKSPQDNNEKPFFANIKLRPVGERQLSRDAVNVEKEKYVDKSEFHRKENDTNRQNIETFKKIEAYKIPSSSEKTELSTLEEITYPEDLNPFGDEEPNKEGQVEEEKYPQTLNPFGESDEEEKPVHSFAVDASNKIQSDEEYDQNLNPFASSDDDDEVKSCSSAFSTPEMSRSSSKYAEASWRPTPAVRTSILVPNAGITVFSSPNQSISTLAPSPTSSLRGTQKKRRAPLPPDTFLANENASKESDFQPSPKPRRSPLLSQDGRSLPSPKLLHKSKPAPLPPKSAASSANKTQPSILYESDSVANDRQIKDSENFGKTPSNTGPVLTRQQSSPVQPKKKKRPAPPVPLPPRRQIKKIPLKEIEAEMVEIEEKQQSLEERGRDLEVMIRDKDKDEQTVEEEDMIIQLFDLVNQKNILFRRQAELMYIKRSQRLEEEQVELEFKIRLLLSKPASQKTNNDKEDEEELLQKLIDVVEQRNEIVESIEMDRKRQAEEDHSVQEQMDVKQSDLPMFTAEIQEKMAKKKKEKHKGKSKEKKKDGKRHKEDKSSKQKKKSLF